MEGSIFNRSKMQAEQLVLYYIKGKSDPRRRYIPSGCAFCNFNTGITEAFYLSFFLFFLYGHQDYFQCFLLFSRLSLHRGKALNLHLHGLSGCRLLKILKSYRVMAFSFPWVSERSL